MAAKTETQAELAAYKKMCNFLDVLQGDSISDEYKYFLVHTLCNQFLVDQGQKQGEKQ